MEFRTYFVYFLTFSYGVTIPPKKVPARETCLKQILQAVIPKNNKSNDLEKIPADKRAFKKKFMH